MLEQLKACREIYLQHLRRVVTEHRGAAKKSAAELWLEVSSSRGLFKNYYRVDFLTNDDTAKTFEANIDLPAGRIETFEYLGIQIKMEPVVWNDVQIECEGVSLATTMIEPWFKNWFDENEEHQPDDYGLSGVIHSASFEGASASVDFGSAPIEALIEFLDLLVRLEPSSITIHSRNKELNNTQ